MGRCRVTHGIVAPSRRLEPLCSPSMQHRHLARELVSQGDPEEFGNQTVMAIPPFDSGDRREEQFLSGRAFEVARGGAALDDRLSELAVERVHNRGAKDEVPQLVGLFGQYLVEQIVDDRSVTLPCLGQERLVSDPVADVPGGEL